MGTEVYENPSDENLVCIDLSCSILKNLGVKCAHYVHFTAI